METISNTPSSVTFAGEDLAEQLAVIEKRGNKAWRWATNTLGVTAGFCLVAAYHAYTMPSAVPSITELALPAEVIKAIAEMSSLGSSTLPFSSAVETLSESTGTIFKVVAIGAFVIGMGVGIIRQSLTAMVLPVFLLMAAFTMPAVLDSVAGGDGSGASSKPEITIECVSERSCISVLNTAAPIGTAQRHFINAQLYAYGGRAESVKKELAALRTMDGIVEFDKNYKETMAALAVAAGEPLTNAQSAIAALAAKLHSDKSNSMNSMLVGAGLWGAATLLLGGFALFLRRRVRTVRSMLKPVTPARRSPEPEVAALTGEQELDSLEWDDSTQPLDLDRSQIVIDNFTLIPMRDGQPVEPHAGIRADDAQRQKEVDWD